MSDWPMDRLGRTEEITYKGEKVQAKVIDVDLNYINDGVYAPHYKYRLPNGRTTVRKGWYNDGR